MPNINPDIKITKIHDTLWEIDDVFTAGFLDTVPQYFAYSGIWFMDRPLARLSFPHSNDLDPFHDLGNELAVIVANTVGRPIHYRKAKIFLDLPGSEVPIHRDADDIDVMAQVYLQKSQHPVPGTMFLEPAPHTVQYGYNRGYFNLNTDKKAHQSPFITNGYRTSMGFQFYFPK
jgi:hypothetical protein